LSQLVYSGVKQQITKEGQKVPIQQSEDSVPSRYKERENKLMETTLYNDISH